jgi:ankyrin repeat protein
MHKHLLVRALLQHGADVNARPRNDMSALDCAVENGHFEIVRLLISSRVDVNAKDGYGQTPLHRAIDAEAEWAKYLYDKGDVDAAPTAEITGILIAAGADVNARTGDGKTPLDWAVDT